MVRVRTLGVDLAAADENTALCLVEWAPRAPHVERLTARRGSDALIVELAADADVVAIDAPFGWPMPFVDVIASYRAGSAWPRQRPDDLWFRRTDVRAHGIAGGRWPLSVSSDRIARPAERAARLLTLLGTPERAAARDGSDAVIEVYPAGALRTWGISTDGYKNADARDVRERIRDQLLGAVGLDVGESERAALAAKDHPLDALIASLVGRAFGLGHTTLPGEEDLDAARREGWIHLPTIGLAQLGGEP
jgi:predicted nuclease with RNAse H fold